MAKIILENGYSIMETPNTYRAFLAGCNHNYYGIKCTLKYTKDLVGLTYSHPTFTNLSRKYFLKQTNFTEIESLHLLDIPHEKFTTFDLFIELIKKYKKTAFIEIKRPTSLVELNILYNTLLKENLLNQVVIMADQIKYLEWFRNHNLEIKLLLMNKSYHDSILQKACKYHIDLYFPERLINIDFINFIHEYKLKIATGIINNPIILTYYEDKKIDYLFTCGN